MGIPQTIGPFAPNTVSLGDSRELIRRLPNDSIDVVVTSPPYWGQRTSLGTGVEEDPRDYLSEVGGLLAQLLPKLKPEGILWLNVGDAYNTPVNWREEDHQYSTLGPDGAGLDPSNSSYMKPRAKREAYTDPDVEWLTYGNLLQLPHRLVMFLVDHGFLFRGEVIWRKSNPMPEGRARRPHRQHEPIYLLTKSEKHRFRVSPPVGSVWEFPNEKVSGKAHFSRYPLELPRRCIEAYGLLGADTVVLDPFLGSGTTGIAALQLGCTYLGFEVDPEHVEASNERLASVTPVLFDRETAATH